MVLNPTKAILDNRVGNISIIIFMIKYFIFIAEYIMHMLDVIFAILYLSVCKFLLTYLVYVYRDNNI